MTEKRFIKYLLADMHLKGDSTGAPFQVPKHAAFHRRVRQTSWDRALEKREELGGGLLVGRT